MRTAWAALENRGNWFLVIRFDKRRRFISLDKNIFVLIAEPYDEKMTRDARPIYRLDCLLRAELGEKRSDNKIEQTLIDPFMFQGVHNATGMLETRNSL